MPASYLLIPLGSASEFSVSECGQSFVPKALAALVPALRTLGHGAGVGVLEAQLLGPLHRCKFLLFRHLFKFITLNSIFGVKKKEWGWGLRWGWEWGRGEDEKGRGMGGD